MEKINIKFELPEIRLGMAVNIEPTKQPTKEKGWLVDPKGTDMPQSLSIKNNIKKLGLEYFALPKFYRVNKEDVRQINNQPYIIVKIDKPQLYKVLSKSVSEERKALMVPISPPDAQGNKFSYPGRIIGINLNTGDTEGFTFAEAYDSIKSQAMEISEQTRVKINEGVKLFNSRMDKIDNATASLANLPLQLNSAKNKVDKRIETIDAIIGATAKEIQENEAKRPTEFEADVSQQISSGQLGERDFADYVLTKYSDKYARLIEDLNNNTLVIPQSIQNPEAYKQKLLTVAQLALDKQIEESQKEEPIREPFDITQVPDIMEVLEVQPGEISTQLKSTGYHSFDSYIGSLQHIISGEEKKKAELSKISTMLAEIAQEIGRLGEGQRRFEYLKTPNGQKIVEYLKTLCNEGLKGFTEKYSKDLVDENGRLYPKLFSKKGNEGNAGLICAFTQIYKIIAILFEKAALPPPIMPSSPVISMPQVKEPTNLPTSTPSQEPVNASSNKLTIKISKTEWNNLK